MPNELEVIVHGGPPLARADSRLGISAIVGWLVLVGFVACAGPAGERPPDNAVPRAIAQSADGRSVVDSGVGHPSVLSSAADAGTGRVDAGNVGVAPPEGMAGVPGGNFFMGLVDRGEQDERPRHMVYVRPFFLDVTEVTVEAYNSCVMAGVCDAHFPRSSEANGFGYDGHFRTPSRPISSISWDNAARYCAWKGKRLPTEAEWERAARGGDERMYPWGNEEPSHDRAVYGTVLTEPVGSRPLGAGPYGHLDLAGNVWEWVQDRYDPMAYGREGGKPGSCEEILRSQDDLRRQGKQGFTGSNPIPDECEYVLRGGAFNYGAWGLRSSNRVHHPGRFRLVMSGFLCAKDWVGGAVDSGEAETLSGDGADAS